MPQPPYPLHESVRDVLDPEYVEFYNKHIIDKQQVHYQPESASRKSGSLIPGAGPIQKVGSTRDFNIKRVESHGSDVAVRVFTPEGKSPTDGWPATMYFHGGGWVLGNIETENVVASHICSRAKCVVISVDYRLAPEDPFPAAVDDCWEALQWLQHQGKQVLGLNSSKIAVAGSSAGGNLAAVMSQRSVARQGPKILAQVLSVPVTDNTATIENNASWKDCQHTPALPAEKMLWYRVRYLPDTKQYADPEASPIFWQGDWSLLPPATVIVGEYDVLRAEGEDFAKKMTQAGASAKVCLMKGMPHPFLAMDGVLEKGKESITIMCEAIAAAFNA